MKRTLLLFFASLACAQQAAQFSTSTQLVIETVSVTGKDGRPVEGLTAKDFVVTENGVPQTVAICEFQKLAAALPPGSFGGRHRAGHPDRHCAARRNSLSRPAACWLSISIWAPCPLKINIAQSVRR